MGPRGRRRVLLAGAVLTLLAAACSSEDRDADPGPTTASSTTGADPTTAPTEPEPVITGTTPPLPTVPATGPVIGALGGSRHLAWVADLGAGRGAVVVEDLATGAVRQLAYDATTRFSGVTVAPDGTVAWLGRVEDDTGAAPVPLVVTPDDEQPRPLPAPTGTPVACPAFLPDGTLLVSVPGDDGTYRPAIVDRAAGTVRDLGLALPQCARPAGPDHVAHTRLGGTGAEKHVEIVRTRLAGGAEEVVGRLPAGCTASAFRLSPDGSRLAVAAACEADPARSGLHLGTTADDLVRAPADLGLDPAGGLAIVDLAWSADGSALVVDRTDLDGTPARLWQVTADGTTAAPLEVAPGRTPALAPA